MSEYVWYRDGKESMRSLDVEGKLITKKIISDDEYISYSHHRNSKKVKNEVWYRNDLRHRDGDEPAWLEYYRDGSVLGKAYYQNGSVYREDDKPARVWYHENGNVQSESYHNKDGRKHRDGDKPAGIHFEEDGSVWDREYFKDGNEYYPEGV